MLVLFSDTGGGHRSAAEAVIEALQEANPDGISIQMVDIFREIAPSPFNRMPQLYPKMVRLPQAWALGYRLTDGQQRARLVTNSLWPYLRGRVRRMTRQLPCDLILSVHPLANAAFLNALGPERPPFITMVTDLVSTHALWYDQRIDLCLVPTEPARQRALASGLAPGKVHVVGLPVSARFCDANGDPRSIRARLQWPDDRPVILLMGGGEGMGPLESIAEAIVRERLPVFLAVVTGRNRALQQRLTAKRWTGSTRIYGYVNEIPDFMRAADVLITKAGPGTISEAFNAGLPLVLYGRLPGQEEGNVSYVVSHGAGVWAPTPEEVVGSIRAWLANPVRQRTAAEASARLARPDAARVVARMLLERAVTTP